MLAFALSGVYAIVDGFFVGNKIGDFGLAAINMASPLTALIQAIGSGIGTVSYTHLDVYKTQGRQSRQPRHVYQGRYRL